MNITRTHRENRQEGLRRRMEDARLGSQTTSHLHGGPGENQGFFSLKINRMNSWALGQAESVRNKNPVFSLSLHYKTQLRKVIYILLKIPLGLTAYRAVSEKASKGRSTAFLATVLVCGLSLRSGRT